jgi:hypothetical protein
MPQLLAQHRRAIVLGLLLLGILAGGGIALLALVGRPPGWAEQQRLLTQLVRRQAPDAVLLRIRADGTWTPAGIQDMTIHADYLRPSGEQLVATYQPPLDAARVSLQQEPPEGPGPVNTDFLQAGAEVQSRIRIGPEDAFRIAHGAILRFTAANGQGCRIADVGLLIEPKSQPHTPPKASWVVMCTIAPHYVSVIIDPYTGAIVHQSAQ